jgi:hypothetical protein
VTLSRRRPLARGAGLRRTASIGRRAPLARLGKHDAKTNGAALCRGPQGCHALVHRHEAPDWRRWLRTRSDR